MHLRRPQSHPPPRRIFCSVVWNFGLQTTTMPKQQFAWDLLDEAQLVFERIDRAYPSEINLSYFTLFLFGGVEPGVFWIQYVFFQQFCIQPVIICLMVFGCSNDWFDVFPSISHPSLKCLPVQSTQSFDSVPRPVCKTKHIPPLPLKNALFVHSVGQSNQIFILNNLGLWPLLRTSNCICCFLPVDDKIIKLFL